MRRGNGDGSIYKLSGKRRKPWAVRVTVGWTNEGKQKYRYIGYYANKTDAKQALAKYLSEPEKALAERQTLKSVFEKMIEKSNFTEGTKKQYISGFRKLPALENRPINEIRLDEIEQIMEGETPNTQARIKKTLSNCYKFALKYDYANKNLAEFLDVKTEKPKERKVFTTEEIRITWETYKSFPAGDVPLILLYSGMRISELLEMKTEDVDLNAGTMRVRHSKTASGVRTVPIHEKIRPIIEKRHNAGYDHLITNAGRRLPYSTYIREFWSIENYTPHECRHTFITELSKVSDDKVSIKKIVGHATTDITDHYTHRTVEELTEVINKLQY